MPFCILLLLKFWSWQSVPALAFCFSANLTFGITCNSNHTRIYARPGRTKLHVPGERNLGLRNGEICPKSSATPAPSETGNKHYRETTKGHESVLCSDWKSSCLQTSRVFLRMHRSQTYIMSRLYINHTLQKYNQHFGPFLSCYLTVGELLIL